jgi:hypothetical protein
MVEIPLSWSGQGQALLLVLADQRLGRLLPSGRLCLIFLLVQSHIERGSSKRQQPHCPQMALITRHQSYDLHR